MTHFSQGRLFFSQLLSVLMCAGKPQSVESSERVQLSGTYNVRKGKLQLPVNRWTRRQVILCGTCLIVSSIKDSQTGKMHILPLIGGKVRQSRTTTTRPDWYRAVVCLILVVYDVDDLDSELTYHVIREWPGSASIITLPVPWTCHIPEAICPFVTPTLMHPVCFVSGPFHL